MFEVGKTYETKQHGEFECIAVTETHAWMKRGDWSTAYVWTKKGKALSLGAEYDIKPKPREFWICTDDGQKTHIFKEEPLRNWDEIIHVREVLE